MAAQTGFWVDHTGDNVVLGTKLTLDSDKSPLLLTGLTLLVTLAGGAAWGIVAFASHQIRASETPTDALNLQEQVILRNSSSALSDVWALLMMAFAWKKQGENVRRSFWRPFRLLLIPLLTWALFAVAGLFVLRVTIPISNANRALLSSGTCGFTAFPKNGTQDELLVRANNISNDTSNARTYAQQCYHGTPDALDCAQLPVQALNYTTSMAACP